MLKTSFFVLSSLVLLMATACSQSKDVPAPIKAIEAHGVKIVGKFDAPAGLKGYAGIIEHRPVAIYLTKDGKYALVGSLVDGKGEVVGQDALRRLVSQPMSKHVWSALKSSAWVREGKRDAPRIVYEFTDANCPYCHQLWQRLRPWIKSGKVQVRHVIVGIIGKDSPNKAATIFTAASPEAALEKNERTFAAGGIAPAKVVPEAARRKLDANLKLMQELGIRGTPGIVFRDEQGQLHSMAGLPPDAEMTTIFGPQ
jgi:thiol:disulfide interchange protein DsbG